MIGARAGLFLSAVLACACSAGAPAPGPAGPPAAAQKAPLQFAYEAVDGSPWRTYSTG